MSWVKLDDGFFRNAKVIAAGRDARDVYVAALCHCGGSLTDGFVSDRALRMVGAEADVDDPAGCAARLVEVGLWTRTDGGFLVHDYHEYQPTAEKVRAERAAAAERMRRVRSGERPENNETGSPEVRPNNGRSSPSPSPSRPTPVDDPSRDGVGAGAPASEPDPPVRAVPKPKRPAERLPPGWEPDAALLAWAAEHGFAAEFVRTETEKFADHYRGKGQAMADWPATWRNWLRRAVEFAPKTARGSPNGRASPGKPPAGIDWQDAKARMGAA